MNSRLFEFGPHRCVDLWSKSRCNLAGVCSPPRTDRLNKRDQRDPNSHTYPLYTLIQSLEYTRRFSQNAVLMAAILGLGPLQNTEVLYTLVGFLWAVQGTKIVERGCKRAQLCSTFSAVPQPRCR